MHAATPRNIFLHSVDDRDIELAEPRRIADDLDFGNLAVRDPEGEGSRQSSPARHHDADGPVHERGPHELRGIPGEWCLYEVRA